MAEANLTPEKAAGAIEVLQPWTKTTWPGWSFQTKRALELALLALRDVADRAPPEDSAGTPGSRSDERVRRGPVVDSEKLTAVLRAAWNSYHSRSYRYETDTVFGDQADAVISALDAREVPTRVTLAKRFAHETPEPWRMSSEYYLTLADVARELFTGHAVDQKSDSDSGGFLDAVNAKLAHLEGKAQGMAEGTAGEFRRVDATLRAHSERIEHLADGLKDAETDLDRRVDGQSKRLDALESLDARLREVERKTRELDQRTIGSAK